MQKPNRKRVVLLRAALVLASLPLTGCALFQARHALWNRRIERDPDGVARFAQAYELGGGRVGVLLVHGFGDGPHVWQGLAESLAAKGMRVRALRLPGWGESPAVKRAVSPEDWRESIRAEVAALRRDCEWVIVAGHSMGGCLTARMAVEGQLDADALMLYAPMFAVADDRSPLLTSRQWFEVGKFILPDGMLVESLFPDHARVAEPRPRTRRDPFVPVRVFKYLYEEMDALAAMEPRIGLPLRLVLPGEDRVVKTSVTVAWFHALRAPAKQMFVLHEAGHVLPLELDCGAEADRIGEWLQQQGIGP